MKLTRSVSYAVGILLQVADASADFPVTAARMRGAAVFRPDFSIEFRRLVDAELLGGTSGPGGGYRLSREPKSITLLDIVSAVDSPPEASRLTPVRNSHRAAIAKINDISETAAAKFAADLRRVRLSELQTAGTAPSRKASRPKRTAGKKKIKKRPAARA